MKLCDKITKLRKMKGLSQEELANELDVSRQSVFKWESGENTPDLEKIKKLAKLFNVTFDELLDDEKDLEVIYQNVKSEETSENSSEQATKYRKVYDSKIILNACEQSDYEHGYTQFNKKCDDYLFAGRKVNHEKMIAAKGYVKTIRVQHDMLVDFFADDKNKTFGFFFDGAPQFICPFENFVSFSIANDAPSTSIGYASSSYTNSPSIYDCSLKYYDENGSLSVYKIIFSCKRNYITQKSMIKTSRDVLFFENSLSKKTSEKLNEISTYLNGIKEVGNQIKNEEISVKQVDITGVTNEIEAGQFKKKIVNNSHKTSDKTNGFAIAGFICSFFVPLLGFIFGGIGLNKSKSLNDNGKKLSIAALIISGFSVLFSIILSIATIGIRLI